ncbi:MAG: UDP-N-acetylmuramoyl-L-alanine--D-glutamate ligase [Spirochaetes bacterium]|nr:UDP-N-acetylmuramoyl-L-alanine--D-glutamate ligase [Spirochaetota bacterium]
MKIGKDINNVLVVGAFGKTGLATIQYLFKKKCMVKATDLIEEIPQEYKGMDVQWHLGEHNDKILENIDLIVLSPGVPSDIGLIQKARKSSIPVFSEIELAYQEFPRNWIGITGTDGKSTTTALTGTILKQGRKNVIVGGNIGEPLVEKLMNVPEDTVVVSELSSFQLENIIDFKPFIGVLLNIAPDHMDRYHSMEDYIQAKMNLFSNQTEEDFAVLNYEDPGSMSGQDRIRSKKYYFSRKKIPPCGCYLKKDEFFFKKGDAVEKVAQVSDMKISGEHNKENTMAAITIAKLMELTDDQIRKGIKEFKGLEHRMELVAEIKGRKFINDSKATTVSAVRMSVNSINDKGIVIMGGRDKGLDFSSLDPILKKKAKKIVLFGEASEKIKSSLKFKEKIKVTTLEEAVHRSFNLSQKGDTILLSPGCASFDMFKNFEERGKTFKKIVMDLKKESEA